MNKTQELKEQLAKEIRENGEDALSIALDLIEEMEMVIEDQEHKIRRLGVSSSSRRSFDPAIGKRLYQHTPREQD